jgi:FkbM family methyltransferase
MTENSLIFVDIGARGGVHSRWRRLLPRLHVISFDADPEAEFDSALPRKNQTIIKKALAQSAREATLYLCTKPAVSSLYRPDIARIEDWTDPSRFAVEKEISVVTSTLDVELAEHGVRRADFIKIDTQGSELDILKGAEAVLENCLGIECEVEFMPMYQDQPCFADVDIYLRSKGFELFDIRRTYWKSRFGNGVDKGRLIFGDALYLRTPAAFRKGSNDEATLNRAIQIYEAYGYGRLASWAQQVARGIEELPSDNPHIPTGGGMLKTYRTALRREVRRIGGRLIRKITGFEKQREQLGN